MTSSLLIFIPIKNVKATGNTLYVGGSGPGNYTTIQSAIDAAADGDTVFVYNGTYYEHLFIYKNVNLLGESQYNTIIQGGNILNVIEISYKPDFTTIQGFTICKGSNGISSPAHSGVWNVNIKDNIIRDCKNGIYLGFSKHFIIEDNIITNNENGIFFFGTLYGNIEHNWVLNNSNAGIVITGTFSYSTETNINICFNEIKNNGRYGLIFVRCKDNIIENNNFIDNGNGQKSQATFVSCSNSWNNNYWSDRLPISIFKIYVIFGVITNYDNPALKIYWIQFDFHVNPNLNPMP